MKTPRLPGSSGKTDSDLREETAKALEHHLRAGRLSVPEAQKRKNLAAAAKRNEEIDALFADLPAPHPRFAPVQTSGVAVLAGFVYVSVLIAALVGGTSNWLVTGLLACAFLIVMTINGEIGRRRRIARDERLRDLHRQAPQLRQSNLDDVRLGNDERKDVRGPLLVHLAAGQIDQRQFADLKTRAGSLKTRAELRELFDPLPPPYPELAPVFDPPDDHSKPWGLLAGITFLVAVPGLPLAIAIWVNEGQWQWLLAWPIAMIALSFRGRTGRRTSGTMQQRGP